MPNIFSGINIYIYMPNIFPGINNRMHIECMFKLQRISKKNNNKKKNSLNKWAKNNKI